MCHAIQRTSNIFFCNGTMICLHIPRDISQFIIKFRVDFFYFSYTTPVMNYDSKKKGFKLNWFWHVIGAFTSISPNFQLNKPKKTLIFHASLTALINRASFDRDLVLRFFFLFYKKVLIVSSYSQSIFIKGAKNAKCYFFFSIFNTSNHKNTPTIKMLNAKYFSIQQQQSLIFDTYYSNNL